jgi:hypothetical protein
MALSRFDRRVVAKALSSPLAVLPLATGIILLLWALVFGGFGGLSGTLGIGALLVGLGVAAYRWLFSAESLVESVQQEEKKDVERRDRAFLTRLRRKLRTDRDPRTAKSIDKLAGLRKRMIQSGVTESGKDSPVLPELVGKADELYRSCLKSLERSLELWEAARDMATSEARDELLRSREALVGEVVQSIDHLAATVDYLQSASLQRGQEDVDIAKVREELEMGLEVARRVTERVNELERGLRESEG